MNHDYKEINLFEVVPEDEHSHIANKVWESLARAGLEVSEDAELSIKVYEPIVDSWETVYFFVYSSIA